MFWSTQWKIFDRTRIAVSRFVFRTQSFEGMFVYHPAYWSKMWSNKGAASAIKSSLTSVVVRYRHERVFDLSYGIGVELDHSK